MTNESYLNFSYTAIAISGIVLAVVLWFILQKNVIDATQENRAGMGRLIRRIFPSWLILAAILGFISVTYFDCSHETYVKIVDDRGHLINKSKEQAWAILMFLAAAIMFYAMLMSVFLMIKSSFAHPQSESQ
jgi:hypothetical protein